MTALTGSNRIDMPEIKTANGSRIQGQSIEECVLQALDAYFSDLDGHGANGLYQMVIGTVEKPLLEAVLRQARGNQTKAAEILGINRGTLRKKLKQYGLD